MKTKRILSWFSVLESTNNMKYARDGKFNQDICVSKIINIECGLTELYIHLYSPHSGSSKQT